MLLISWDSISKMFLCKACWQCGEAEQDQDVVLTTVSPCEIHLRRLVLASVSRLLRNVCRQGLRVLIQCILWLPFLHSQINLLLSEIPMMYLVLLWGLVFTAVNKKQIEALHVSFGVMIQALLPGIHSVSWRCGGCTLILFLTAQVVCNMVICFQPEL